MSKQNRLLIILLAGFLSIVVSNPGLARGILGHQPGDRSPEDNVGWLQEGVQQIQMAIVEADEKNGEKSVEHGKAALAAMKEISSEGWDGKRQRSVRSIRHGIKAAKQGKFEDAAANYRDALKTLDGLEYGNMNFTHESFLGIGDGK
jgi:Small metal-binding protein